ncbi:MAG: agmatine deiminase family protein [Kiritimatiellae bacterium]|nr:agmatine deiminase family protein [Kiritimatiellia bacterium]
MAFHPPSPPRPAAGVAPAARHPAEWEPQAAAWIIWPHTRMDWPGKLTAVAWDFAEIVRILAPDERVRVLVQNASHERRARMILELAHAPLEAVDFLRIPSDRSWARDTGPIFVEPPGGGPPAIAHFEFNAWGKRDAYEKDAAIPERAARWRNAKIITPEHRGRRVVLEGGAIDVNGRGSLITTEQCLLDANTQVRNEGFRRADYEEVFARWLGAPNTLWLNQGIAGDLDTHGHVDDICRFVGPSALVLAMENNPADENHRPLRENRERLQDARLEDGSRPTVVELPMPAPLRCRGQRLPASYANFFIGRHTVLVPTFNDPADRVALGILAELFPDRVVRGIHGVDILLGLGGIHCLTHEEPEPFPLRA